MSKLKMYDGTQWVELLTKNSAGIVNLKSIFDQDNSDNFILFGTETHSGTSYPTLTCCLQDGSQPTLRTYPFLRLFMNRVPIVADGGDGQAEGNNDRGGYYLKADYGDNSQELWLHKVVITISSSSKIEFTYINTEQVNLDLVYLSNCLSDGYEIHCKYYNGTKWLPACFDKVSGSTLYFTYGTTSVTVTPSSSNTVQTTTKLCYNTAKAYTS